MDWERVRELFVRARELEESELDAFLAADDITDSERREVRSLLANDDDAFLATPALGAQFRVPRLHQFTPSMPETIGPFTVRDVLGEGASSIVYLGVTSRSSPEGRSDDEFVRVAIKVLKHSFSSESSRSRFFKEIEALGRLEHESIAGVLSAGTLPKDGRPWFAMEYVAGCTLAEHCAKLPLEGRIACILSVARAVGHAHTRGIVHRDLKPANILVTSDGAVRVLDFGIARFLDEHDASALTASGQLLGTLPYMSPEQLSGDSRRVAPASDVYSLGVLAYEVLTGQLPYSEVSFDALVRRITSGNATRVRRIEARVSAAFETIVHCAIDPEAERRYADANAMADDLERALEGLPVVARGAAPIVRMRRFAKHNRGLVAGLAVAFVALLVGAGFSTVAWLDAARQARTATLRLADVEREKARAERERAAAEDAKLRSERERARSMRSREYLVHLLRRSEPRDGKRPDFVDILEGAGEEVPVVFADDVETDGELSRVVGLGLWAHGRRKRATEVLERVCARLTETFGEDDERALRILADLLYMKIEREIISSSELEAPFERATRVLGQMHPVTVRIGQYLLRALPARESASRLDFGRAIARASRDLHGARHAATLDCCMLLAGMYVNAGQVQKGLALMRSTHKKIMRALGPDDIACIFADYRLGTALGDVDQSEALQYLERGYARACRVFGPENQVSLKVLHNLASARLACGQSADGMRDMRLVYEGRRRAHGDRHSATITSAYNLAYSLEERGEVQAALEILRPYRALVREVPNARPVLVRYYLLMQKLMLAAGLDEEYAALRRELRAIYPGGHVPK